MRLDRLELIPGPQWPGGGQDDTLRRAESVCAGDTNPDDAFDASVEWVTFPVNTFDGLGSHTANCGSGPVDLAPSVSSTTPANNATDVAEDTNITVDFSEDVAVTGDWFEISCNQSGLVSAIASGGPQSYTLDPDSNFLPGEKCSVTIFASAVTDQDGTPDNMAVDYTFSFWNAYPLGVCGEPATFISAVQGSGAASPCLVISSLLMASLLAISRIMLVLMMGI